MKVTLDNYKDIIPVKNQELMHALLVDLCDLNNKLSNPEHQLYIDFISEHNEYSPERVDPCPDYYGMYRIKIEGLPEETLGCEMTIEDIDTSLCVLINFVELLV